MKQISEFLSRFRHLGLNESLPKEALINEINSVFGPETLSHKDITIKNQTAFIKGGSALKSEIFLNKKAILNRVGEKLGASFVVGDIR